MVNDYMESFEQLCQRRRSIRKYTDRPVEQEKIDYMLRSVGVYCNA